MRYVDLNWNTDSERLNTTTYSQQENVMTDSVLTYRDCYNECKSLALEIIEDHKGECETLEVLMEYAWRSADDHEWVIYPYLAHEFLAAIAATLHTEAEDTLRDMGAKPESYDDYASQLTYWAINIWVSRFVEECLQEASQTQQIQGA